MSVGDLVTYWHQRDRSSKGESAHVGLVVETGKYTGNRDVKVLWAGPRGTQTECMKDLLPVDDSLTT